MTTERAVTTMVTKARKDAVVYAAERLRLELARLDQDPEVKAARARLRLGVSADRDQQRLAAAWLRQQTERAR